jgi:hypothetical protein
MDEMYEMIELTDAELDAVAAGQGDTFNGVQNNGTNSGDQGGIGQNNGPGGNFTFS